MKEQVRIVMLVDNLAQEGFLPEYGFCLWIEVDGEKILFDTGQIDGLFANAAKFDIDLRKVDKVILSHGHYDHAGALDKVIDIAPNLQLYYHPGALRDRYSYRHSTLKAIHIPDAVRQRIKQLPDAQKHEITTPQAVSEHLWITGEIPRKSSYEDVGGPFFLDTAVTIQDALEDDQAIWINTQEGLIICVGCSHSGVINTVEAIRALNPGRRIKALIGGFHLLEASAQRLSQTIAALNQLDIELIMPCHCTGDGVVSALVKSLGSRVACGAAGTELVFPL